MQKDYQQDYQKACHDLSGKIIIAGELVDSQSSAHISVFNPATRQEIGYIAAVNDPEINLAVISAHDAYRQWQQVKPQERGRLVQQCGQIITDNAKILAEIMSYETGKALRTESHVELSAIADVFNFYGGLSLELKGETIPFDPNMLTLTIREPLGVIGAIIPWNVPLLLFAMKIAPALIAGNSVVLKTSPEASFCVLKAVELINRVLPQGLLNVITGGVETGKSLVSHPQISKVTFTGSVESGIDVYKNASEKMIPVTLELGGKSPFIICADADLDAALKSVYEGMRFTRQGQSCSAASRLFVHESIHDIFIDKLLAILDSKLIGDPMDAATDIGAIISKRQYAKVQGFLKLAEEDENLTVRYGSSLPKDAALANGLFLRPAVITGIANDHEICQKEIFGPVLAVIKWSDFDRVISEANATKFGLAAGIWTKDLQQALQAAHRLDAGFVQINQYIVFRPSLPFGGFKHSGLGKEASLKAMLEQYTKEKTIIINMNSY